MKRLSLLIILIPALLIAASCGNGKRTAHKDALSTEPISYARNLTIEYHDGYTSVYIRDPWDTLRQRQHYILVEHDKALPTSLPGESTVIRIPVKRAVIYTSVHSAIAVELGVIDRVVGVCEPEYITSPELLRLLADGKIADIGLSTSPNVEKIVNLDCDLIIASPFENSGYGSAEKLGIPILEAADYLENHPLGRTEWVLFYGLVFGCPEKAHEIFQTTRDRYLSLKSLASKADRPTVLLERKYGGTWAVPAGESYIAVMHADAGANYLYGDTYGSKSIHHSFEEVYDRCVDADFWFLKYGTRQPLTYALLAEEYTPYANFKAWKEHKIFTCSTLATTYYDDITLHPDRVLEDLVAIYHPDLLPGHVQRYYFPMNE